MRCTVTRSLFAALLLLAASSGHAATPSAEAPWRVVTSADKSTESARKAATTTNAEGYALFVFRTQEGPVYAMFLPPPTMHGRMGMRAPTLRIDASAAIDLDQRRKEPPSAWPADPVVLSANSASFLLAGKGKAPQGDLRDLMNGQKLAVQWFNADGDALDTAFDLKGAKEAIAKAVDVPVAVDPADLRAAEQRDATRRAALAKCGQWSTPSLMETCRRQVMDQFQD
jgi:hypothetical protein